MAEIMYDVFCLGCSGTYTEDLIENTVECRRCGSNEIEWTGFEV